VVSRFDVCHTTENRLSSIGMYAMFSRPVNTMSSYLGPTLPPVSPPSRPSNPQLNNFCG
jgi:hypothetical protein